jgi:hypothetical protein
VLAFGNPLASLVDQGAGANQTKSDWRVASFVTIERAMNA